MCAYDNIVKHSNLANPLQTFKKNFLRFLLHGYDIPFLSIKAY